MNRCNTCTYRDTPLGKAPCGVCVGYNKWRGDKPRLLILGHGRHGKDTVAELLARDHGYTFISSSLAAAEIVCRPWLERHYGVTYETAEECYEDRHNWRAAWYDAIAAYNLEDPTRLCRSILEKADCYVGMRSDREYKASFELFDCVLWVDAGGRGLPQEPADSMGIQYDPARMYYIDNNGTLEELERNVAQFVRALTWKRD